MKTMNCRDAIIQAIEAMELAHCVEGMPQTLVEACETLERILEQGGCEHFDKSVADNGGFLTDLMDVVIFG